MRLSPAKLVSLQLATTGLLLVALPASAKPHTVAPSAHPVVKHGSTKLHKSVRSTRFHEPTSMAPERAVEIQNALIKSGYLTGAPTGVWDAQSSAAMAHLQGDNGWQTKITPDSRALIKLGLGPQAPPADQVVASK